MWTFIQSILVVVTLWAVVLADSDFQVLPVTGRYLTGGLAFTLGHLNVSTTDAKGIFLPDTNTAADSEYCVAVEGVADHECIAVTSSLLDKSFKVYVDSTGAIDQITLEPKLGSEKPKLSQKVTDSQKVAVVVAPPAPTPNLHPKNIPKKQLIQSQAPKEPIRDADGNIVTAATEEEPKSWVQQNWMYIVPPLLIMFVLLGDDEKK